ncbi:MAG: SGNH/GDSL hydrolase family protein [Tepidiformaceae bacterium]
MRILVLGQSDSEGGFIADRSLAWPWLLEAELPALVGEPVEVGHRRLWGDGARALAHLEAQLAEHRPDFVVLMASSSGFALRTVANRLRQLFGRRVGRWAHRRQEAIGGRAREAGRMQRMAIRVAQRAARRIIGVAGAIPPEVALATYASLIRRLAREEQLPVVIMGGGGYGQEFHRLNRGMASVIEETRSAIREVALSCHFAWIDQEAALEAAGDRESFYGPDGVHRTVEGHRAVHDALLPLAAEIWLAGRVRSPLAPAKAMAPAAKERVTPPA